jgi:hypothetical protein
MKKWNSVVKKLSLLGKIYLQNDSQVKKKKNNATMAALIRVARLSQKPSTGATMLAYL